MGQEVTRRGFLQSIGISFGAVLVATTPLKLLDTDTPKRLEADTAKKSPEPTRKGGVIRTISFGDGTTVRMTDWGDYPLWSKADDRVIDVESHPPRRTPPISYNQKRQAYSKRAPHIKRPMYNKRSA